MGDNSFYDSHLTYTAQSDRQAGTVLRESDFGALRLSNTADQILVYTGSRTSPTFLSALDNSKGYNTHQCDEDQTIGFQAVTCSSDIGYTHFSELPPVCRSPAIPALTGRFAELLLTLCTPLYTPHAPVLAAGADAWSQRDRAGSQRRVEVQRAESRQQGGSGRSDLHLQHWQLGIRILRLVILQCTDGLRCHSDASAVASVTAIASILTPDTADVATATTAGAW